MAVRAPEKKLWGHKTLVTGPCGPREVLLSVFFSFFALRSLSESLPVFVFAMIHAYKRVLAAGPNTRPTEPAGYTDSCTCRGQPVKAAPAAPDAQRARGGWAPRAQHRAVGAALPNAEGWGEDKTAQLPGRAHTLRAPPQKSQCRAAGEFAPADRGRRTHAH